MSETAAVHNEKQAESANLYGVMAEFKTPDEIIAAAEKVKAAGYTHWDVHTPYPVHGMDDAMGIRPTILPWIVLGAGITGAALGLLLQWFTNAVNYPFLISGKPYFSLPANIPIIFEVTVLLSAFTAFAGVIILNGLPRLYNPVFKSERFYRVTNDRFFIVIHSTDPRFNRHPTEQFLSSIGGTSVEVLED